MGWTRMDDNSMDNPKLVTVGAHATCVWLWSLNYATKHATNGFIPAAGLNACPWLAEVRHSRGPISRLVANRLWHVVPGGYEINDYLDYNLSASEVKSRRANAAKRQRDFRDRLTAKYNGVSNAVTDGPSTRPDPTQVGSRSRKEQKTDGLEAAAFAKDGRRKLKDPPNPMPRLSEVEPVD